MTNGRKHATANKKTVIRCMFIFRGIRRFDFECVSCVYSATTKKEKRFQDIITVYY